MCIDAIGSDRGRALTATAHGNVPAPREFSGEISFYIVWPPRPL